MDIAVPPIACTCHCYIICRDGCVKCTNVVEYAVLVCVLWQPVPPSIHPSIHYFGRFLLEVGFRPRTCIIRAREPTNGVQQLRNTLCPHDRKALELYAQNKATPKEFPNYWWLFWTQHLLRYSPRLVENRKKKLHHWFYTVSGLPL